MSNSMSLVRGAGVMLAAAALGACGGGGGSGSDSPSTGTVSFGISDAPVPELSSVTITVDKITVNRPGEDIVIDRFTSAALGLEDADTFTIDLLSVQGMDSKIVADFVELPAGDYQNLRLAILEGDINLSWVDEAGTGQRKVIKVPSGELKLGGFNVAAGGVQVIMVEFGLREALTYNPGPDRYILKPRGVRVVDVAAAVAIGGDAALDAFALNPSCSAAAPALDPPVYVVYAYQGHGLADADLADSFDPAVAGSVPAGKVAPYASAAVSDDGDGTYSYLLPYLPAGDYTLAFSCAAAGDDPEAFDDLSVPLPALQRTELAAGAGERWRCDFADGIAPACAPAPVE